MEVGREGGQGVKKVMVGETLVLVVRTGVEEWSWLMTLRGRVGLERRGRPAICRELAKSVRLHRTQASSL